MDSSLPEYQNKGYGKSLVNSLLMKLKNLGAKFATASGSLEIVILQKNYIVIVVLLVMIFGIYVRNKILCIL